MAFSTQEEAQRVVKDKEFDVPQWSGRAYECPKCGNWHMTTVRSGHQLEDDILSQKRQEHIERNKKTNSAGTTVEGSRAVSSSGGKPSGTIAEMLDGETLEKIRSLN